MCGSKRSTRYSERHFRILIQLSSGGIVALLIPLRTSMPVMAFFEMILATKLCIGALGEPFYLHYPNFNKKAGVMQVPYLL